jgi:hypothetical protein
MRNGAALIGERGRGEMRLVFGAGADNGGKCLAAATGVLARGGWGGTGPVLTLEYAESTLFGLNTPLGDLIPE